MFHIEEWGGGRDNYKKTKSKTIGQDDESARAIYAESSKENVKEPVLQWLLLATGNTDLLMILLFRRGGITFAFFTDFLGSQVTARQMSVIPAFRFDDMIMSCK